MGMRDTSRTNTPFGICPFSTRCTLKRFSVRIRQQYLGAGLFADAQLAADLRGGGSLLDLPQGVHNLLVGEARFLYLLILP